MDPQLSQILKDALALPSEARAALAESLLESLDKEVDDDAFDEWRAEIRKRTGETPIRDSGFRGTRFTRDCFVKLANDRLHGSVSSRSRGRS